jgi:hypothetical protein
LFSESSGRFVCEIAAEDVPWLAEQLGEPVTVLGEVTDAPTFELPGANAISLDALVHSFGARP